MLIALTSSIYADRSCEGRVSLLASPPPLLKMDPFYENEAVYGNAYYMSPKEREKYRLEIKDGLILRRGSPLTTLGFTKGVWIWVLDENDNFYAHPWSPNSDTYHSSFFAGAPVRSAGLIRVNNGLVEMINNESGHYKPSQIHLDYAANILGSHQLFTQIAVEPYQPDRSRRDLSKDYALP